MHLYRICKFNIVTARRTIKPCCHKGTARCRSCCFWFKVRQSPITFTTSLRVTCGQNFQKLYNGKKHNATLTTTTAVITQQMHRIHSAIVAANVAATGFIVNYSQHIKTLLISNSGSSILLTLIVGDSS